MASSRHVLRLAAEPPMREGHHLRSPVLQRAQALRALTIFTVAFGVILFIGVKPASADAGAPIKSAVKSFLANTQPAGGKTANTTRVAQLDLRKFRQQQSKKKLLRAIPL